MCKTNWSRKGTDKLQELFIKTDKKSKLTKLKEKVKLTNGNGQGTCDQKYDVQKKKRRKNTGKYVNWTIQLYHKPNESLLTLSNTPGIAAKICIKAKMIFT